VLYTAEVIRNNEGISLHNVVLTRSQVGGTQHRRQRCWIHHRRPCPRLRCVWPPNDLHDALYRRQVSTLQHFTVIQ